jgi:hypothetical protein
VQDDSVDLRRHSIAHAIVGGRFRGPVDDVRREPHSNHRFLQIIAAARCVAFATESYVASAAGFDCDMRHSEDLGESQARLRESRPFARCAGTSLNRALFGVSISRLVAL